MNNKSLRLISLPSLAVFLTACGGGSSSNSTEQATVTTPPIVVSAQPRELETVNWQNARLIQSENPMQSSVEVVGSSLNINVISADIATGAHLQIYINSDNKAETGFQFDNQAWEESGVDFLIEDGDLFKSTANNSGWNWNVNIGAIEYSINTDRASASIDLSLLGDICNNLKIGVMTRDEFWDIETFSPASSQMQTFNVAYCNTQVADTVNPVLSLLGANPINLTIGDTFNDPGATASDNIDGDITSRIHLKSDINTAIAGSYEATYVVTDLAGNSASITRTVVVSEVAQPEGIVVDGNTNDWADIPALTSSADAVMKVTDNEEKLYILITSSNLGDNTQLLMDTDNNAATGLELSAQVNAWLGGADYMIENNSLDKSKSNTGWSWDYGIATIEYIKTADALEIAIKKSDFNALANDIPMGYVSRTAEWNANYTLPKQDLPVYSLKFPTTVNPVSANNDSETTLNTRPITIDVLANDSSSTNGALTVSILSQPQSGSASVVQNKIRYQPVASFTGTVNFNYEIKDSAGNKDTANVKIIVTAPINIAPIAVNDSVTTTKSTPILVNVLENDVSNSGSGQLTIIGVGTSFNASGAIVNGQILYTPNPNFLGTDSVRYTILDSNGEEAIAFITVRIEAIKPEAQDDSASTRAGIPINIEALGNDLSNSGSDDLTITSVGNPSNGTAQIVNGLIVYKPNADFIGADVFTYTITDSNAQTATATITVTIDAKKPEAIDDSVTTAEGTPVTSDVLNNDTTFSGSGQLVITGVGNPQNGTSQIVNDQIVYTPISDFTGTDTFLYTVTDSDGETGTAIVTVTVIASINIPPIANDDFVTTDGIKTLRIFVENNDSDPDRNAGVTLNNDFTQPTNGTVVRNTPSTLDYTPNPTFSGTDTFTYSITDIDGATATATVTVTVPENNDPDAVEDIASVFFNETITLDVLANDTDPDGDTLSVLPGSVSVITQGQATLNSDGTITFDPQGNIASLSVFYTVTDGRGGTDSAVWTIASTDPDDDNISFPTVNNEFVTTPVNTPIFIDVLANDFDSDGDTLSIDQVDTPANGTTEKVTQNGIAGILYTPNPGFTGVDIFFYGVPDGRGNNGAGFVEVTVQ